MQLQGAMPEYIGKLYSERFFSEEAKQDVTKMAMEIVDFYKERIGALTPTTCVGLRYGHIQNNSGFSWQLAHQLRYL